MIKCYLCGTEITEENKTVEHIVLNSIGGRLKSSKLICKNCNSKFGNTFDACLSKQLEFFANFLDIKRENGDVQDIEMTRASTGEKYKVTSKGVPIPSKPIIQEKNSGATTELHIQARNITELRTILKGFKKKYPDLDIEKTLKDATTVHEHIPEPLQIQLSFGGKESMPAILKMAINYYLEKTNDTESVKNAINDLKQNSTNRVEPIIFNQSLFNLSEDEVTHCIFINGSKKEKKLYAIIELYSSIQFIIKLSDNYNGTDLQDVYIFDVIKRKEIHKELTYIPTYDYIFNFDFPSSEKNYSLFKQRIDHVMKIGVKRQKDNLISEAIEKTMNATFKKLPKGHLITEEDTNQFVDELMKNITPLFIR